MTTATLPRALGDMIRTATENGADTAQDIADAVIAMIDPADYGHYLRQMLLSRVSSVTSTDRGKATPKIKPRSVKGELIRHRFWPSFLQQQVAVDGVYKALADASPTDLRTLSCERVEQARKLQHRAAQFSRLADIMDESGITRLGDLREQTALTVIGSNR